MGIGAIVRVMLPGCWFDPLIRTLLHYTVEWLLGIPVAERLRLERLRSGLTAARSLSIGSSPIHNFP